MEVNSRLPKIMYDQTQFTAVYLIDKGGLWINEAQYFNMEKISGYAPEGWITYTQNKPVSFWFGAFPEETLKAEAEWGFKNFTDKDFLKEFTAAVGTVYGLAKEIRDTYFRDFYNREKVAAVTEPEKIIAFVKRVREVGTFILSYYLLTQPQRFYKFEEELKKYGVTRELEVLSTNGRYLTFVTELRKAILDYADLFLQHGENISSEVTDRTKQKVHDLGFLNWGALGGELIDWSYVEKEVASLLQNPEALAEEHKKIKELASNIEERNKILKGTIAREHELADIMGHSSIFRFDLQTCMLCLAKYVDNLLQEVRKHHGLEDEEFKSYELDEVLALLQDGKKISPDLIEKRQRGYLRVYRSKKTETFIGEDALEEIRELLEFRKKEIEETKEVKGTVASWPNKEKTKVQGRAFVLTTAFEGDEGIKSFKPEDILVATQTHPNLVPKMKEALAIVTDEGGITCHAAIVSRELGKPCIIGTRLASKIFKTGDTIELDFSKGIVRKV